MSGVGDLVYDKDAVYININDNLVLFSEGAENGGSERKGKFDVGEEMVKSPKEVTNPIDEQLQEDHLKLFSGKQDKHEAEVAAAEDEASGSDEESDDNDSDSDGLESSDNEMDDKENVKNKVKEHVEFANGRTGKKAMFGDDDHGSEE